MASLPLVPVVGVSAEQDPPADGSPITSAAYPSNWPFDIPSQVVGATWVTAYPAADSTAASGAALSPFWSSTSTGAPEPALAGPAVATAAAAATPAATATAGTAGSTAPDAASTGPSAAAIT